MDFQTAVQELLGQRVTPLSHSPPKVSAKEEKKEFRLPETNTNMHRVYAYLIKQRFISPDIISHFVAHRAVPCCPFPTFFAFIPLSDLLSSRFTTTKKAMKITTSTPIKIICLSFKISPPIHKNMLSSVFKRKVSLLSSRYCTVKQTVSHQPNSIQGSGSQTMSSDSIWSAKGSDKVSSTDNLTALSAS